MSTLKSQLQRQLSLFKMKTKKEEPKTDNINDISFASLTQMQLGGGSFALAAPSSHILLVLKVDLIQLLDNDRKFAQQLIVNHKETQLHCEDQLLKLFRSRFFWDFHEDELFSRHLFARQFRLIIRFKNLFTVPEIPSSYSIPKINPQPNETQQSSFVSFTALIMKAGEPMTYYNLEQTQSKINRGQRSFFDKVDIKIQVLEVMPTLFDSRDGSHSFRKSPSVIHLLITDELVNRFSVGQHVFCIGELHLGILSLSCVSLSLLTLIY